MRTLAQATWLNDEVISMWLGLLNVRTLEAGNVKRVHFFETHFFAASFATLRASCAGVNLKVSRLRPVTDCTVAGVARNGVAELGAIEVSICCH